MYVTRNSPIIYAKKGLHTSDLPVLCSSDTYFTNTLKLDMDVITNCPYFISKRKRKKTFV